MSGYEGTAEEYYPGPVAMSLVLVLGIVVATAGRLDAFEQAGAITTGFHELLTLQLALVFWWFLSVSAVESRRVGAVADRLADALAPLATGHSRVVATTAAVALVLGVVNWALGLFVGLFVGRRLYARAKENGVAVDYTPVVVAALSSLVVANQGLSAPAGLVLADDGFVNVLAGTVGTVPFGAFLLHPANVLATGFLVVTLPLVIARVGAIDDEGDDDASVSESSIAERFTAYRPPSGELTPAERLENSRPLGYLVGGVGLLSAGWHFLTGGEATITWLLFVLLMVAVVAHDYPQGFVEKTTNATSWTLPVAIPFVFYAAGYVMLADSGLAVAVGDSLVAPVVTTYLGSLGLGLLVPDPGSVWLLVAPFAASAGADAATVAVASSFGSGVSNLWLGFVFLGLFAPSSGGLSTRTFVRIAGVVTMYTSFVVLVALLVT